MILLVGLGNPGLKFKKTRHNIGFRVLDAFQKENNFPKFKLDKKSKAEVSTGTISDKEIMLVKPQGFMNSSGEAVKSLLRESRIKNQELSINEKLVVIHDDFDLPFGEIKLVENSGSGGHHGVESIIQALGTRNFKRLKIGIKPISNLESQISNLEPQKLKAEDFVLKKFTKNEEKRLAKLLEKSNQILTSLL